MSQTDLFFQTIDSPCANGRTPREGDVRWNLRFPLADGRMLTIEMGEVGWDNFLWILKQDADLNPELPIPTRELAKKVIENDKLEEVSLGKFYGDFGLVLLNIGLIIGLVFVLMALLVFVPWYFARLLF